MKNFLKTFITAAYCITAAYFIGRVSQARKDIDAGFERVYVIGKPGDKTTVSIYKDKIKKTDIVPFDDDTENKHTDIKG